MATTPLVPLQTLKDWLGITNGDQDAKLTIILAGVSAKIGQICGTDFQQHVIDPVTPEILDGGRSDFIIPRYLPVISVQTLWLYYGLTPNAANYPLDADQYQITDAGIMLRCQYTPQGRSNVAIAYTGGYTAVPDDVIQAALISAEAIYLRMARKSIGVNSRTKTVGAGTSEQEQFTGAWDPDTGLPKDAIGLLQAYKDFEWPANQSMATRNY